MPNPDTDPFYHIFKQWEERHFGEPTATANLAPQQRTRSQPPYERDGHQRSSQPVPNHDEIVRRLDRLDAAIKASNTMSEQVKVVIEENLASMNKNIERFEIVGRELLQTALQPNNLRSPLPKNGPNDPESLPKQDIGDFKIYTPSSAAANTHDTMGLPGNTNVYSDAAHLDYSTYDFMDQRG